MFALRNVVYVCETAVMTRVCVLVLSLCNDDLFLFDIMIIEFKSAKPFDKIDECICCPVLVFEIPEISDR